MEVVQLAQNFPRFMEPVENRMLMVEVQEKELLEVIHSFQKDKIPGPDSWMIEFYLCFLDTLGSDLLHVVDESRLDGFIHRPFNATFIALIRKSDESSSLDEYRLISLCNCIYKIISKIISRQIKGVLSTFISCE